MDFTVFAVKYVPIIEGDPSPNCKKPVNNIVLGTCLLLSEVGAPQKVFTFDNSLAPRKLHRCECSKFSCKAKRSKCFCDFSRCLTGTSSIDKFNFVETSELQND